jgi:hypothetical protein
MFREIRLRSSCKTSMASQQKVFPLGSSYATYSALGTCSTPEVPTSSFPPCDSCNPARKGKEGLFVKIKV